MSRGKKIHCHFLFLCARAHAIKAASVKRTESQKPNTHKTHRRGAGEPKSCTIVGQINAIGKKYDVLLLFLIMIATHTRTHTNHPKKKQPYKEKYITRKKSIISTLYVCMYNIYLSSLSWHARNKRQWYLTVA